MNAITWLSSFPKSGNTWLRVVLANLIRGDAKPVQINAIGRGSGDYFFAADRQFFDELLGYESCNLSADEVDALRPDVYRQAAATAAGPVLCKVHDAYMRLSDGRPLFPPDVTAVAVYIVRNPLDVCASLAHHSGADQDATAAWMADASFESAGSAYRLNMQLRQIVRSWSAHVSSWADTRDLPVHVIRYEDMQTSPIATFGGVAAAAGIPADGDALERAVRFSAIEELQRQEQAHGFHERVAPGRSFFRKGKIGGWRESLSDRVAARIIRDHRDVMRRFGYLTEGGEPVY
jgi:hypothetical protein